MNEEDHLRIISMEKGKNVRAVFDRFAGLVKAVEGACKDAGRSLEISEKYGNILSCPSNCGTGLRASMMIKIPLATKEPNFKDWCAERKLPAWPPIPCRDLLHCSGHCRSRLVGIGMFSSTPHPARPSPFWRCTRESGLRLAGLGNQRGRSLTAEF